MTEPYITPELFQFLSDLTTYNDRTWFQANKKRYETAVRQPLLRFIADFDEPLGTISPSMVADPRKVGGSLFRIHRDTRFSKDKSPYKTWAAVQFRHEKAKDVHAPGFYLHLQPGSVFAGAGIWHPDREALEKIRDRIAHDPDAWGRVRDQMVERGFGFEGESLKRIPRGYDKDHPAADELRRKDFIVIRQLSEKEACAADFADRFAGVCRSAVPLMEYLTGAVGLAW
jgi:uncharacterized protein (TIGR02453 family)